MVLIIIYFIDFFLGQSLFYVGVSQEIELYVSKESNQSEILSQSRAAPLNRFINMLKDIATIFGILPRVIHVFYDDNTNSIAFNYNQALFFNLKFYLGFHDNELNVQLNLQLML